MWDDRSQSATADRNDRGQTVQDFAIGVGVFLLAVAFAFTTVPALAGPDASLNERDTHVRTDQIATAIIDDLAAGEGPTELDGDRLQSEYEGEQIRKRFGIRAAGGRPLESVRITLETTDRETKLLTRGGAFGDSRPTDSVERLVSVNGIQDCQTACRLIVEVWD